MIRNNNECLLRPLKAARKNFARITKATKRYVYKLFFKEIQN